LEEKVELPVQSTRQWSLYRAVSTDAGSECSSLSAFVYSLNSDIARSSSPHINRSYVLQAAENNAKVFFVENYASC